MAFIALMRASNPNTGGFFMVSSNVATVPGIRSFMDTDRGLIVGTAQPGVLPNQALDTFRAYYPSKRDTIERALVVDRSKDRWCLACETTSYKPGELSRFRPAIIESHGRIHFAGAYCDNLNWGQEAATRSANRVAREIHAA